MQKSLQRELPRNLLSPGGQAVVGKYLSVLYLAIEILLLGGTRSCHRRFRTTALISPSDRVVEQIGKRSARVCKDDLKDTTAIPQGRLGLASQPGIRPRRTCLGLGGCTKLRGDPELLPEWKSVGFLKHFPRHLWTSAETAGHRKR